jgi:hypothetical protein
MAFSTTVRADSISIGRYPHRQPDRFLCIESDSSEKPPGIHRLGEEAFVRTRSLAHRSDEAIRRRTLKILSMHVAA